MLKKARHIAIVLGLLLCITLSFAWITELDAREGRYLHIQYDKSLYSAAAEMDARLYHLVEPSQPDGEVTYEDITQRYESAPDALFSTENFAPGEYRLFALRLQNKTNTPMSISINLAKLEGDPLFLDHMKIGISGSAGFSDDYPAPVIEEFAMADRASENGDVTFVEYLMLPPTEDPSLNDNIVEIKFYIRFSHTAVNELQDKIFKIGVINVLAT